MSANVLDDRTFESAVEITPEEQAATNKHFLDKGYELDEIEVIPEEGAETIPATPPIEQVPPAPAAAPAQPPADGAAPAVENPDIDEESRADWQAATNDGQKLGQYARRTKKIRELEAAAAERERENIELKRQLAEKATPAAPSPFIAAPAAPPAPSPSPAPVAEAPITAKVFDKARPARPKLADFSTADDPYGALTEAGIEYVENIAEFDREKREFDEGQRVEVARQQQQRDQVKAQATQKQKRAEDVIAAHPDFATVTGKAVYSPILQWVVNERLADGYELAYHLGLPENAETLKELNEMTTKAKTDEELLAAGDYAIAELGAFRKDLKRKAATAPATPEPSAPPAAAQPIPPAQPPRREEAAPAPTRGHVTVPIRVEDVNAMDSDTRREMRRKGLLQA